MLGSFLTRHFAYLNFISEWLGLSEEDIERTSKAVSKTIGLQAGT
jgi:hypothetical protein